MNKMILVVGAIIVLGGGYFLMNRQEPAPVENTMPAPGSTGVEEMVVQGDAEMKKITLDSFEFGYDQKTITVKQGDTVEVTLTNSGKMPHDWIVDEFAGAKTKQIKNGETDTITFVADKKGTYEFYCSVGQHRKNGMVGTLVVE